MKLENPCTSRKDFCVNCHSHFMAVRPYLRSVVISKHFIKDLKGEEKSTSIVKEVLDCSSADLAELHKFEESVDGCMIFRAKKKSMHIVYCVDKNMRIIFLRALGNYGEYVRFLEDKKNIKKMIASV